MIPFFHFLENCGRVFLHPRLKRERLLSYQNRMLRRLVIHAQANVPYYRELFKASGIDPRDIKTTADLPRIPATSKKALRRQPPSALLAEGTRLSRLLSFRTTGSTGVPYIVKRTAWEEFLLLLFSARAIFDCGLKSRDRMVRVRTGGFNRPQILWRIFQRLGCFKQDSLETADPPDVLAEKIIRTKPDVLIGYTGVLAMTALSVARKNGRPIRLKFIIGTADMLTPLTRRQIGRGFSAPIYDHYATQEAGLLGWECPKTGLFHLCEDCMILEVLKDGRPAREGEEGEAIVTFLHGYVMPFIRFKLDDLVVAGPKECPCGAPFATLRSLVGKKQDYFILPGGRKFYGWNMVGDLSRLTPWVQQYQFAQEAEDLVVLRVVAEPLPTDGELAALKDYGLSFLGTDVRFEVEIVPEVKPGPGGKFHYQYSRVNSLYE